MAHIAPILAGSMWEMVRAKTLMGVPLEKHQAIKNSEERFWGWFSSVKRLNIIDYRVEGDDTNERKFESSSSSSTILRLRCPPKQSVQPSNNYLYCLDICTVVHPYNDVVNSVSTGRVKASGAKDVRCWCYQDFRRLGVVQLHVSSKKYWKAWFNVEFDPCRVKRSDLRDLVPFASGIN